MSARSESKAKLQTVTARRRWLTRVSALASSAALPLWVPGAWAHPESFPGSLPRTALVIGNSDYAHAPLRTPSDNALAVAVELQKLGFKVKLRLDAGRTGLIDAIREYTGELAQNKGAGFFYFAGHGAQHEWRNYLIPAGAAVSRPQDLRNAAVELNAVLEGLSAAGNALNVIALDACRDSPFGKDVPAQRGLAQLDAPSGILLAFAAAPGATADDDGLYSGTLLRELAVPGASIEDAFKRVRVAVRSQSRGWQIPWQSAALADDFYMRPLRPAGKSSSGELERRFDTERATWQKAALSSDSAALEDYLRRHPSGAFSELGQFRLEKLMAENQDALATGAMLAAIAPNPFSKGTLRADPGFTRGDSYTYKSDGGLITETITRVTKSDVIFDHGAKLVDLLGNELALHGAPTQLYPVEYAVGRKWITRLSADGTAPVEMRLRITGKEMIAVPAGTFDAFKIEGEGYGADSTQMKMTLWVAPEISRRPIAIESAVTRHDGVRSTDRRELAGFTQRIAPAAEDRRLALQTGPSLTLCNRDTGTSRCSA